MSKKFKSIVAMLLAMVMVLAMAMPTFAAEKGVTVRFNVESSPEGTDESVVPSDSYLFTFDGTSNAFTAIETAAKALKPGATIETGTDTSVTPNGKYFNNLFGLKTINKYEDRNNDGKDDYWEGYSWNIQLKVKQANGTLKTIDSPYYANLVDLGATQTFTDYTGTVLATGEVTAIIVTYKGDSMSW